MSILKDTESYSLIAITTDDDWETIYKLCNETFVYKDYIKVKQFLEASTKTIIIEKNYIDKDYRNTYYNFFSKKFAMYPPYTFRLHFFNRKNSSELCSGVKKLQKNIVTRYKSPLPVHRTTYPQREQGDSGHFFAVHI